MKGSETGESHYFPAKASATNQLLSDTPTVQNA